MQSIRFEREKMNNYMVLPCNEHIDRTSYSNTVMEIVDIPSFMMCQIREINGQQNLYYKLKYRTSVGQVLGDLNLTYDKVRNMLCSIVSVIRQAESYLLDAEHILWRSNCIFVEASSGKMAFAYYPGREEINCSLNDFLIEIIQYIDKRDQNTYMYIMGFYNLITNPDCSLEQIIEYVDETGIESKDEKVFSEILIDKKEEKQKRKLSLSMVVLSAVNLIVVCMLLFEIWTYQYIWVLIVTLFLLFVAFLTSGTSEEENPDSIMEEYLAEQEKENGINYEIEESHPPSAMMVEEETTILTIENSKIVLEERFKELYLKAMNPKLHKDIHINEKSVVLGSMRTGCDYTLKEKGISRMHAKLLKKEDGLFLMDMNSTNGTFLNDEELIGGKEYLLKDGDVVSLAYIATFVVVAEEI